MNVELSQPLATLSWWHPAEPFCAAFAGVSTAHAVHGSFFFAE